MRRYEVTKIVFANNMQEIISLEKTGEITYIVLKDDIEKVEDIGFIKSNGTRNNLVS